MTPFAFVEPGIRHAALTLRTLLRHKGIYLAAVAILAVGIAMSVVMFSLVDAVLLRPLPFPEQGLIQVIWKTDSLAGPHVVELAYPELHDLQENISDFEYVAVMPTSLYGYGRVIQAGTADPVQVESAPVSHDFFRVLGVSPRIGRDFAASDEQVGASPVVVLSDWVWREHLAADPTIVGKMIRLNGRGHTVIGVMAPAVDFPRGVGLWIPLGVEQRVVERRGATFLQAIARVRPGVSRQSVVAQVNSLFTRLAADYPDAYSPSQQGVVTPVAEYWTGSARLHLWIMLGASLLLLVASAISAGNLLLSRTLARRHELATRAALGARPRHVISQIGVEGFSVGVIAALAGLALAQMLIRLLVQWAPADIPRLSDAALDAASFAFAAVAAAVAAVASSILPAWFIARGNLEASLRAGSGRISGGRIGNRTQSVFVSAQAAVTAVLLAMAVLLVTSYRSMITTDTGFANRDTLTMNLALRGTGLFSAQARDARSRDAFYTRLLENLRDSPGVTSAAAVLLRPLEGTIGWDVPYQFEFEAAMAPNREPPRANFEVITPGYFETVGTPLLEGRDFNAQDAEEGEPVAIISHSLAERIRASGRQPLGHTLRLGSGLNAPWMRVIGVSADARYRTVTQTGDDIYVPYLQSTVPTNYVVVRGSLPVEELTSLVRRTLAGLDPSQAIAAPATLASLIDRDMARHRFNMIVLLCFGFCAVILAAAGIYSVVAESVGQRSREIAIKTALGARRRWLIGEMVRRALVFVLAGELVGLGCVIGFGHLGSELLYGVSPRDPEMLGSVLGFLFIVCLAAAFFPAWAAAGRDPKASLRES